MESPQPYAIRYTTYSPQEAANLLLRISFEDTIALPPVKPKAGDVFIFRTKILKVMRNNYKLGHINTTVNSRYIEVEGTL